MPQSSQLSAVYSDIEELTELLVSYFKQGIERGEYCLWTVTDALEEERVKKELEKADVSVEKYLTSFQLVIINTGTLSKGSPLPESAVKELMKEKSEKAFSEGFPGFRMNVSITRKGGSLNPDPEKLEENLKEINRDNERKLTYLCTFPLEELSGSELLRLVEEKGVLVKRKGGWECLMHTCNINGQKELETTLLRAKKDAEATNRAKNSFIMNMSHELRTPLNSVIGFSDLLLEGAFGPMNTKQSKYVNNILISGKNLLEIINNLLDISRLEAGEKTLKYEDVDVASLIGEVRMNLLSPASVKKINVELKIDPSVGNVEADISKLRQILYNLVSNAIKFTPARGKVVISACKKEGVLEVKVSDNGIGISEDSYEKIFMPFTQADSSAARGYGGAGLGLFIVRNFVDLHGGDISVDSEVGKGSTFTFTIPAKPENTSLQENETKKWNHLQKEKN
ncbi:MEDS domain-containing protein [Methanosarcina mazei]|uniref:histidine kinase n=1 Tax=Methanosarcina mazei TaxID=2209 RepID=A0A4P8R0K5_METMZ|nr:MEDS domain-containing protein [Methanosarcina mazei]MDO5840199.1 ATP-binding protein [Methanosarcina mazei]QCR17652.1 sensor histidine kinase [Methanosarcina mazei]QIB89944.1 sensor histidine kinase [Methanosarcina mazei]